MPTDVTALVIDAMRNSASAASGRPVDDVGHAERALINAPARDP